MQRQEQPTGGNCNHVPRTKDAVSSSFRLCIREGNKRLPFQLVTEDPRSQDAIRPGSTKLHDIAPQAWPTHGSHLQYRPKKSPRCLNMAIEFRTNKGRQHDIAGTHYINFAFVEFPKPKASAA
ncbi:uncharacterized protein CLUP02_09056 [Colletotrichum lupini]|uniref:Uncharacterized protein n=1 Tax=Colletotrichum lupini TaxID=145971 RepID=A0A9Q8SU08_9PEZI|nr:uncharacterized protein CLUP02_09056 [Colletotrichum lupini]UQC83562.1 hypothetical protein CLUP02_09056 [Colletotrichum lupini]